MVYLRSETPSGVVDFHTVTVKPAEAGYTDGTRAVIARTVNPRYEVENITLSMEKLTPLRHASEWLKQRNRAIEVPIAEVASHLSD